MAGPSVVDHIAQASDAPSEGNEVDGAVDLPYRIPHMRVEWRNVQTPVPLGVWRSVGQSQNVFAVESFIDELAHAAGSDAVRFRRELIGDLPRLTHVLDVVTRASQWGRALKQGRGCGVAINRIAESTFVALIAQVAIDAAGAVRVERLTCAVDCGQIVNPLSLRAQVEGGLGWGLAAAFYGRISIREGAIEQSNFHDYPVLRMKEMPALDIHLVESRASPGGIGEHCSPPVAPALANALYAACGQRFRTLPLPARIAA
jgi:isoquinoline 1-oxidoreductase beta subunit